MTGSFLAFYADSNGALRGPRIPMVWLGVLTQSR